MTSHADYWTIAQRVCTEKQLNALRLHTRGVSFRTISLHLGISDTRARALVQRATQKIELELRKEPAA